MPYYSFHTLDVFSDRRFGGNPLAIFPDAGSLSATDMQALAAELNLSETVFISAAENPDNDARVRIYTPKRELPFAGHPLVGTGFFLAQAGLNGPIRLELPAGITVVNTDRDVSGQVLTASIKAPQCLAVAGAVPEDIVAAALSVEAERVIAATHRPTRASVGVDFVLVEVDAAALATASPDTAAFHRLADTIDGNGFASVLLYSRDGNRIRARMFAPLDGIPEDPATGSANATLAAFLLSMTDDTELDLKVSQGVEMGRPSQLRAYARRDGEAIYGYVGGACIPMFSGQIEL